MDRYGSLSFILGVIMIIRVILANDRDP